MGSIFRRREVLRTTPWRRRTAEGVYFGHNGSVWAYFEWPLSPLQWEDPPVRLREGGKLNAMLTELGATAADLGGGMRTFALTRSVHLLAATYDLPQPIPGDTTNAHAQFLEDILPSVTPGKSLLVGVKLWPQIMRNLARGGGSGGSLVTQAKALVTRNVDSEDSFDAFRADYDDLREIFARSGATKPTPYALAQLESWFNYGNGPDAQIHATATELHVTGGGDWELSAVTKFTEPILHTPASQWLLEAMAHSDPAVAVSIRADLTPNTIIQAQLRQSQRKLRSAREEEERTGDISRDEIAEREQFAKDLENNVRSAQHAWLTDASILFARAHDIYSDSNNSFLDMLRHSYGIETKTLEHRQLEALDEMQPCSNTRANPFTQVLNPAAVGFAGLPAFSTIGDPGNLWLGRVDPDYPSCFIDAFGAPRHNKPAPMAILGDSGSGKAQPLTAKILTPAGWTTMGALRVGDAVIGRDGDTHHVTGVFPQGVKPIYRVTFNDGSSTEATDEHLWAVNTSSNRWKGYGWQVRTTEQLRDDLVFAGCGKRKWQIPVVAPVQFPASALPLDPYLLGALVGDGGLTAYVGFSSADPEILDQVRDALPQGTYLRHKIGHDYQVVRTGLTGPNPVMDALRDLGLMGKRSETKFLPEVYLRGSVEQRLALLQGLLDTDGTVSAQGAITFNTSGQQLAHDVVELVQSLGGTARLTSKDTSYSHNGERRAGLRGYRVTICLPNELGAPFRLPRKRDRWVPRSKCLPARIITEITYLRDEEAQCIAVSAPDRLYITDGHIVTHNTFAAQLLAGQAALSGVQTIMINPKGFDSLASFADWVKEYGVPASVVSMSEMEAEGGAFDPFRFAPPQMAAEILTRHILTVVGANYVGGLTGKQEIWLGEGLQRGAEDGARCAYDALQYVRDPEVIELVLSQAKASPMFRLGFGFTPQPAFHTGEKGLTLIQFDREMALPQEGKPPATYEREERIALAALRLVTRASMEILMRAGGGVLVVDEAHHYLNSPEGLASLQRLGREGRSLNLLPIFATQRVSDLLDADMENHLSRVLVMKLTDPIQATAALRLCGLEVTEERIQFLREAGPRGSSNGVPGRPSLGLFRDLFDRHSVVMIGPVPEHIRLAFSTNPDDRKKRAALLGRDTADEPKDLE